MEIFGSMLGMLSQKVVSIGIEQLKETVEFKNTQKVLRQRLFREVAFNHEINRFPNIMADQAITSFDTRVLFEILDQPFLISDLFPRELEEDLSGRIDPKLVTNSIKTWISLLETEADLIEKLAFRMKTHELRKHLGINLGSRSYIRALVEALYWSLKREE